MIWFARSDPSKCKTTLPSQGITLLPTVFYILLNIGEFDLYGYLIFPFHSDIESKMQRPDVQLIPSIFRNNGWGPSVRVTPPRFPPFHDVFHPVFPQFPDDLTSELEASDTEDSLFKLPAEISDLILTHLTPIALDAARQTCKLWRRNIMNNRWVLSRVTDLNARQPSWKHCKWGDEVTLRDLQRSLDREPDLTTTDSASTWRVRFRTCHLEFAITQPKSGPKPNTPSPKFKAVAHIGSQYGFVVLQLVPMDATPTKSTLVFFQFDCYGIPVYAGSAEFPASEQAIEFVAGAEVDPMHSWIFKIRGNYHSRFYLIESRDAFSQFESRFSIKETEYSQVAQELSLLATEKFDSTMFEPSVPSPICDHSQRILALFPASRDASGAEIGSRILTQVRYASPQYSSNEPRYLVEHVSSGNVIVVRPRIRSRSSKQYLANACNQNGGGQSHCGLAVLLRPYTDHVYRNTAVAAAVNKNDTIRVAIIWQSKGKRDQRSELYVYNVPKIIHHSPDSSYAKYEASYGNSEIVDDLANYRAIRGKRVTSLAAGLGGIHPLSSLWDMWTTEASKEHLRNDAALGGLQFSLSKRQYAWLHSAKSGNCFVWGPAGEGEAVAIHYKIFDFSFDDTQKGGWRRAPGSGWASCACALHDEEYHIALPSLEDLEKFRHATQHLPKKLRRSSMWPWRYQQSLRPEEPVAVVTPLKSEAWKEAVDRERESFKERIKCMKGVGLSNVDIAELWSRECNWFIKPAGWQDL